MAHHKLLFFQANAAVPWLVIRACLNSSLVGVTTSHSVIMLKYEILAEEKRDIATGFYLILIACILVLAKITYLGVENTKTYPFPTTKINAEVHVYLDVSNTYW